MLQRHCTPPSPFTAIRVVILASVIGLITGAVLVPRVIDDFGASASKEYIAKHVADMFAYDLYRQWARDHPGKPCPHGLLEVALHAGMTTDDALDPWGVRYRFYCGRDGVVVVSTGPDRLDHTDDDITSY